MTELEKIKDLFLEGKITRRKFLACLSALGLTAALSPPLLTPKAHALEPKKGGRLRLGMYGGATTDTLDPAAALNFVPMLITLGLLRNNLVELDYKGNALPELAESWEPSPNAAQWTFKLRKNVEFHNGKTMDAEDVLFSINHHRKKDSKSGAKGLLTRIKDIKTDGKYIIIFTLEEGNADFPFYLGDYHLGIVPAGTTDFEKGIGTGGYMLVKHEPGVRCFTKRNPNYWKEGRAHFDEVDVITINDSNARTNALQSGEIDCMDGVDPKTAYLLEKSPGKQLIIAPGWRHYTMPMFCDTPPFDNNDTRLALKYAIDRDDLVKKIFRGYCSLGNDHPIASNIKYYASELPQREYDLDKARYHIKKAGYENHTFKLHCNARYEDIIVLYKNHAAKAGINIEVVREPIDGYGVNVWRKKPWMITWWGGRPTVDQMLTTGYAADAPWNDARFKHERFNKLLKEARSELDEAKRLEMYVEMQRILRDEGGTIIPLFPKWLDAATTKLKFENVAGNFELDGLKAPERWWFS